MLKFTLLIGPELFRLCFPRIEVIREVEPLSGPMPDFAVTLKRKIEQRSAFVPRIG